MEILNPGPPCIAQEAILFADVSGSTALYERIGDTRASQTLGELIQQIASLGQSLGGRLIKTIGDEVMMWFPDAASAVTAAIAMHHHAGSFATGLDVGQLGLRIGLMSGPMEHRNRDVFGDTVNTAARLAGLATRGSITTDTGTLSSAGASQFNFRSIGLHALSGKAVPIECVEILWSIDSLTASEKPGPTRYPRRLSLNGPEGAHVLESGQSIRLGRAPFCEVRVANAGASKHHATISSTVGNFVLSDLSTNGTLLITDGQEPLLLRREKTTLSGCGRIILGAELEACQSRTIQFALED